MTAETLTVRIQISPENNRINKRALRLVDEARRLHGTLDINSLSPEEWRKVNEEVDARERAEA